MADSLEILAGIEHQVAKARRLAIETRDSEAAAKLRQIADDLERYVRETLALHCPDNDNGNARVSCRPDS